MRYIAKRADRKFVHMPDEELKSALKKTLKKMKFWASAGSSVSVFGKKDGMKILLQRHIDAQHRFFILVDLVHAFHQVTRDMVSAVYAKFWEKEFDFCFVEFGGKKVLPIGAPTSNFLFEVFMGNVVDRALAKWAEKYRGHVTRYADNMLVTFNRQSVKKHPAGSQALLPFVPHTDSAFEGLRQIFKDRGLEIRCTPRLPRLWEGTIKFCGISVPRLGVPFISKRRFKEMYNRAKQKDAEKGTFWAVEGVSQLEMQWAYDTIEQTRSRLRQQGVRPRNRPGR